MMTRTTFPIHDPDITSVPWALMVPHGAASLVNYGLTLAQLADRGGVTPAEAVALIEDRPYMAMGLHTARDQLREYARGAEAPVLNSAPTVSFCACMDGPNDPDPKCHLCHGSGTPTNAPVFPALTEALELARLMRDQNLHNRYHFNKLIALLERA